MTQAALAFVVAAPCWAAALIAAAFSITHFAITTFTGWLILMASRLAACCTLSGRFSSSMMLVFIL